MASSYQIIVRNLSQNTQYFFVFQKQARFQPAAAASQILASSLGCQSLGNYGMSGAQISFSFDTQVYAGAVSTMAPLPPPQFNALIQPAATQYLVTSTAAAQPIALSTGVQGASPANCTMLALSPLGLSAPAYQAGLAAGSFGIAVPPFTPAPMPELFCGVAALTGGQNIVLSSFVAPTPNMTTACAPQPVYFVKIGFEPTGNVIAYDESLSARCDFTTGFASITATYNANGTFSTKGGP
ncbi:hypothetical protein [Rhizobium sp. SL42]|uniref:hypothetical protein n=1 Tax=Rhizobium sp. SL42 TaxID=2806346 RepID=UPI001F18F490|nr:hypothetical protein [Rhizobium sp. SL42]UJW76525.1 hypothetical protein IM739_08690 [Rhizobium sp. SL42]